MEAPKRFLAWNGFLRRPLGGSWDTEVMESFNGTRMFQWDDNAANEIATSLIKAAQAIEERHNFPLDEARVQFDCRTTPSLYGPRDYWKGTYRGALTHEKLQKWAEKFLTELKEKEDAYHE